MSSIFFPEAIKLALFAAAIFISNIVQSLTGFAGVMLSIPPSMILFGPDMAKAVVNAIAWLVSVWIMWKNRQYINQKEILRIITLMLAGMAIGLYVYAKMDAAIMVPMYGTIIIAAALKNLLMKPSDKNLPNWIAIPVLLGAGIVHGMFASGGALLVIYLIATFRDKNTFRANVAAVWSVLNLVLMFTDFEKGLYTGQFFQLVVLGIFPLFGAVYLGNKIHDMINQKMFNRLTYGLLLMSGSMILL